ncbi:GTPase Era [Magnetospirillum gryphiswaldense]|uniref:GTPase Era n=2 Tax=Magnetospirillum gryphiswaldense TaxID=55518 RepID=V6F206_MAGGM|nr:GTPase Era [Magnetospirillum gryphiswaldense]AVM73670.1 GTPase Era [Magnetospirillum gryphiswaldense MSR-1]AVM77573.1 GTPase Era [Magnetospirillum gryphiswaldense]CAM76725.1 GTP-binding protein Era [Magnetospirillum gryphiswaldense MSR-1]CDK98301.1 GTP-binding protein (era) [Magnetospirillum gryphiswaldense MSR-1 v2]
MTEVPEHEKRCGYVAIVGAPNAGKSTLTNGLVGTKVSIVSPKVQTTRFRVLGILMTGPAQVILVDTPGIFQPKRRLDRAMVAAAWHGASDAEIICLMVDAHRGLDDDTRAIIDKLKGAKREAILVLNKVDMVKKERLLDLTARLHEEGIFTDVFMVSALKGDGLADLSKVLSDRVPLGPWMFPEDEVSDLPQRMLAAEITREKAFIQLHEELPYALTVETEKWEEREDGSARIDQVIYVQRDGQKAIVVGKGGHQIKTIGAAARTELEALLERRVHLFLHVKVREDWQEKRGHYNEMGLDFDA